MKIYQVFHEYDVDGGFGDAVYRSDLIGTFLEKEDAEDFVRKYSNPHIYDKPYAALTCGSLYTKEIEIMNHNDYVNWEFDDFWWMDNPAPIIFIKVDQILDAFKEKGYASTAAYDRINNISIEVVPEFYLFTESYYDDEGEFQYNKISAFPDNPEETYKSLLVKHFGEDFRKFYYDASDYEEE